MLLDMSKMRVLLSEETIQKRVKDLGQEISKTYEDSDSDLILVGVLKGCFLFLADLCRHITVPHSVDFLGLSSYGESTKSTGVVKITSDLTISVHDKEVLIVEDIVDTGLTMKYLIENMRTRKPKSLRICSLLYKPENEKIHVDVDFLGFRIPDRFVFGYGLDLVEKFRNLPYIGYMDVLPV